MTPYEGVTPRKKGFSVDELVQKQMAKAARSGITLSYDEAFKEMVADSMEAMLTDGSVVLVMAELKQQDQTLWQKICDWFKDLVADLKAVTDAYKGYKPNSPEGRMVAEMDGVITMLEGLYTDALLEASENYKAAGAQKNTTQEDGVKYQARRLTENDLEAYLSAGSRKNKGKAAALTSGYKIILTSQQEIKEYIGKAINKKAESNATVAYGKVNDRLAQDVYNISNGKIQIKDNYLELIPDNLKHAYEEHSIAKQEGDIDLAHSDFEQIPDYLDSYTEVVYAIKYSTGKVNICVSKKLPSGRILLIETVSKSRGALQFKNAIGVSESKYQSEYIDVYKKRAETNTRGSESSNNSLRDSFNSSISIRNPEADVKEKFSIRDSEGHELTEEQQAYFKDSKARDAQGQLLVLYHQTDGDFTIFDTRHPGAGSTDGDTPFGIFLKRTKGDIGLSGKKQMALYANIQNPLRAVDREDLTRQLRSISAEYASVSEAHQSLDNRYQEKLEAAKKAWSDYVRQWRKANPDAKRTALYDDPRFSKLFDAEDALVDEWTAASDSLSVRVKEAITRDLRNAGYDGIFLANDTGSFGRQTYAIIALSPEQVKNIDNKHPTADPDIRYSLRDPEMEKAAEAVRKENEKLREDVRQLRQLLKLQRQVTGGTKFTASSVEAAARYLKQAAGIKGSTAEFA